MTKNRLNKITAAALAVLAASGAQAFNLPLALAARDVQVELGATGLPGLRLSLYGNFLLDSAQLDLQWLPSALSFAPARPSVLGADFGGQVGWVVGPDSLRLGFDASAALDISDGRIDLDYAFVGQALGQQGVNYALTLVDDRGNRFDFNGRMQVNVVPEPASYALMLGGLAPL